MKEESREFIRAQILKNSRTPLKQTREYLEYGFKIVKCPVCSCDTLDDGWICEECGWEHDGCKQESDYSCANRATVGEYRNEYKAIKEEIEKQ